jgi:hypothetical protein
MENPEQKKPEQKERKEPKFQRLTTRDENQSVTRLPDRGQGRPVRVLTRRGPSDPETKIEGT